MRHLTASFMLSALLMSEVAPASIAVADVVQVQNNAQEKAARLRSQLTEIEAKQSELQTRLQKLEENLKPENIEHNLAGIGSTRPEDLREQRRRQLEIERNGVRAQLDLLATSHTRMQTAIAQADAEAYRQSAAPVAASSTNSSSTPTDSAGAATTPKRPRRAKKRRTRSVRRAN